MHGRESGKKRHKDFGAQGDLRTTSSKSSSLEVSRIEHECMHEPCQVTLFVCVLILATAT